MSGQRVARRRFLAGMGALLGSVATGGLSGCIDRAADDGFSWGEHVLNGKRWATEENMRVPFIVRMPGGSAG